MESTAASFVITSDGLRLAYRFDGPPTHPVLLLSNSIATDLRMWDGQIAALTRHFRVLRYDARGHGASDAPAGAYSMDRLGRDVVELLDALGLNRVHVLGLSLGGIVAQWLAIHAPERVDRLVLANTAAHIGPPSNFVQAITELTAAPDMAVAAARFLKNWFPARMLEANDPVIDPFRRTLLDSRREGIIGSYAALRDSDLRRTIALIRSATLVIAGEFDMVTSADHGREIASTIPGAQLLLLPVVHLANVEQPAAFLDAVITFLNGAGKNTAG